MRHEVVLKRCRPEPLGSYLKALGVLRLVGQQADPSATGRWTGTHFVLTSTLDRDGLVEFLLEDYVPTPMVSPWNKGSGVARNPSSRSAVDSVDAVLASDNPRLDPFRHCLLAARRVVEGYGDAKSMEQHKEEVLRRCRAELPDAALDWIDAAAALTPDGPAFAHILGTGGNLGRLDLSANLLQHLALVVGVGTEADTASEAWLTDALLGVGAAKRIRKSAGQHDPGAAGGVNASTLDGEEGLVNPWDYILQLEGALLFASGVTRRLSGDGGTVAAMPFTFRTSVSGAPHLAGEETLKGEIWTPLWAADATASEVRRLFSEARVRWRGGHAANGLDAARSVGTLGADRGVGAFGRHVVAERLGQNPIVVSLSRVGAGQSDGLAATAELDWWIRCVRRGKRPAFVQRLMRSIDDAMMSLAVESGSNPADVQRLLVAVAALERRVYANKGLRDDVRPVPRLTGDQWLPSLDDGTPEFAVALGFAHLEEAAADSRREPGGTYRTVWRPSMSAYLRHTHRGSGIEWASGPRVAAEPERDVVGTMAAVHVAHATRPRTIEGVAGGITTMPGRWVAEAHVEAFAAGALDDRRIGSLVAALALLDGTGARASDSDTVAATPSPVWRYLAPIFYGSGAGRSVGLPDSDWPMMLTRGAATPVLRRATARYRSTLGPLRTFDADAMARACDPRRIAAALLLPVSPQTVDRLVGRLVNSDIVSQPQEREETPS